MQHIKINADTSAEILTEIKDAIGGTIQETWGEHKLIINNLVAKGYVKFIPFDYGVSYFITTLNFLKK
ncbi:hypothetical protein JCM19301_1978 [Jejuia pallidilutea]|uniref:Uncharacterized protein n=1 Tax=Jejuia pallidilutea TaxID=504487 RepID=A0A090VUH8_9FLAO|nr:hypothetical protein [Jejuia pallidilutea]GAL68371.1 hypothetical protein JCM19301_1978 [Jejuia pallidilutea]